MPLKALSLEGLATVKRSPDKPSGISAEAADKIFRWADYVIAQPCSEALAECILLSARDYHKKKLIVDLDDNIWAVHPMNVGNFQGKLRYIKSIFSGKFDDFWDLRPVSKNYKPKDIYEMVIEAKGKPMLLRQKQADAKFAAEVILKECDAVTTTNPALAAAIKKVTNKPIHILPNFVDSSWKPVVDQDADEVTIGWCGSVSHYPDLEPIVPVIDELMSEFPSLKLQIMGSSFDYFFPPKQDAKKHGVEGSYDGSGVFYSTYEDCGERYPGRMTFNKPVPIQEYNLWMSDGWRAQIGIAPIIENEFNASKSELKWLEYTALGSVTVASNFGPYYRSMTQNVGRLAKSPTEWKEALTELIRSRDLRKQLVEEANRRRLEEFSPEIMAKRYHDVFSALG